MKPGMKEWYNRDKKQKCDKKETEWRQIGDKKRDRLETKKETGWRQNEDKNSIKNISLNLYWLSFYLGNFPRVFLFSRTLVIE